MLKADQRDTPVGGSVTLNCSVEGSGWNYSYQLNTPIMQDAARPIAVSEGVDQYSTGPIRVSEGGVYRCRAGRGVPVYYTDYSDDLTLKTTDGE